MSQSHKIIQFKDSCRVGTIKIQATTVWWQDTDTEYHFDVNYKAKGFPLLKPVEGKKTIPVSGNIEGNQPLLPGVEAKYEVRDWKISKDHAHCHGKVIVSTPLGSCVLVNRDFDGELAHISHTRFQAAIDKAESEA